MSSEGIEKELRNDKDISDSIGKYVNARFYEKVENFKEVEGHLISFENNVLTSECNIKGRKKTIIVKKEQIKYQGPFFASLVDTNQIAILLISGVFDRA